MRSACSGKDIAYRFTSMTTSFVQDIFIAPIIHLVQCAKLFPDGMPLDGESDSQLGTRLVRHKYCAFGGLLASYACCAAASETLPA